MMSMEKGTITVRRKQKFLRSGDDRGGRMIKIASVLFACAIGVAQTAHTQTVPEKRPVHPKVVRIEVTNR